MRALSSVDGPGSRVLQALVVCLPVCSILAGAATLAAGEVDDALVYAAIVDELVRRQPTETVTIARRYANDRSGNCDEAWRGGLAKTLPEVEPVLLDAFCRLRRDGKLSAELAKRSGERWPAVNVFKSERHELALAFSRVAYSPDGRQALVYVEHDDRGDYWLLESGDGWAVRGDTLAWIG